MLDLVLLLLSIATVVPLTIKTSPIKAPTILTIICIYIYMYVILSIYIYIYICTTKNPSHHEALITAITESSGSPPPGPCHPRELRAPRPSQLAATPILRVHEGYYA